MLYSLIHNASSGFGSGASPALDPILVEGIDWETHPGVIERVTKALEGRMDEMGISTHTMICVFHESITERIKIYDVLKPAPDKFIPEDTIFILTTVINGFPTIYPSGNMSWIDYALACMRGETPKILVTKPFLQAKITFNL